MLNVFGVRDKVRAERERLNEDRTLSPFGRNTRLTDFAKKSARPLADASRPLRQAQRQAEMERAQFLLPPMKADDLVGELQRREIRDTLRSLPVPERAQFVKDLAESDVGVDAILSAPPGLVRLSNLQVDELRQTRLEKLYGPRMAAVKTLEDDLVALRGAVDAASKEIRQAAGLNEFQFQQIFEPMYS